MPPVYVTGHRNPDLDSIAAAIGYAELKNAIDPATEHVPVRLGEINAQTFWALARAGAKEPELLEHAYPRVCDVMRPLIVTARASEPVRHVGLRMAEQGVDLVPVVDDNGALVGALTERDLAKQYIRESRAASSFGDRPVSLGAIAEVLGGEIVLGPKELELTGRLWTIAMDVESIGSLLDRGDIAIVGDRMDAQRRVVELGARVLVIAHNSPVEHEVVELAREHGAAVVASPFDSYVTGRLIGLAVPCRAIMSDDPPAVEPDDLVADVADRVNIARAAFAVDDAGMPIGIVTRADLVTQGSRRVILVDHAEQAQSVPGIEEAAIVEILDHHHIGSIETRVPVRATFDPVGSTATLVAERFRREGIEPSLASATLLLAAVLSDTVLLSSPTTTSRDEAVVDHLEEFVGVEAREFGMDMFRSTSDVSALPASAIITRDAKEYTAASGATICIAQVETVGTELLERQDELLDALAERSNQRSYAHFALMVTDILTKDTQLLVAGNMAPVERAFGVRADDHVVELPGVMSRKKQVAPKLLTAL